MILDEGIDLIRKLLDEETPDPEMLDGSTWERRRYSDQIERRIYLREQLLFHELGIHREAFDLARRLVTDKELRNRVEALLAHEDLAKIFERVLNIRREERTNADAWLQDRLLRCERCETEGAQWYEIRYSRRLCERCANSLARHQRSSSTNIKPALATARRHGLLATLTLDEWARTIERFDDRCAYCNKGWDVVEHVTPTDRGGGTTCTNCLPACHSCNRFKGSKTLEEWIAANSQRAAEIQSRHQEALDWLIQNGRSAA